MVAIGIAEILIGVTLLYLTLSGKSRHVFDILFLPDHKSHQPAPINVGAPGTTP